jgi:hypothetical protein
MVTAMKPFLNPDEAVLKRSPDYLFCQLAGSSVMTIVVAFLVCCSAAVFLAHAVDAYQAG